MMATSSQTNHPSNNSHPKHVPVLLEEVLHYLKPQPGESYLDATAGYGGHASQVLERTAAPEAAVLVDRDINAVTALQQRFAKPGESPGQGSGPMIVHQDFYNASRELSGQQFDMILADLGVSSPHLNHADRGFAIAAEGPLDMRMDQRQALTAAGIVNSYPADELADILKRYGEEPKARAIAKAIVANRPFTTTSQLAEVVARQWPGHSKTHPATRSFQALRIAVNDELRLVAQAMPLWVDMLKPGGRLVVISFHSLEDRLVKQALHEAGGDRYDAKLTILTKRPVVASPTETVSNPRARSAKLRAAVRK